MLDELALNEKGRSKESLPFKEERLRMRVAKDKGGKEVRNMF